MRHFIPYLGQSLAQLPDYLIYISVGTKAQVADAEYLPRQSALPA
jgi:hypothetical protein